MRSSTTMTMRSWCRSLHAPAYIALAAFAGPPVVPASQLQGMNHQYRDRIQTRKRFRLRRGPALNRAANKLPACSRFSKSMAILLFSSGSCVENSSFSATIRYPYATLPLQIDPVLLLKYRIRLGILSQMGIVATRYVWVYKKARGLNEKSCFLS
jgi:hypothetical protein